MNVAESWRFDNSSFYKKITLTGGFSFNSLIIIKTSLILSRVFYYQIIQTNTRKLYLKQNQKNKMFVLMTSIRRPNMCWSSLLGHALARKPMPNQHAPKIKCQLPRQPNSMYIYVAIKKPNFIYSTLETLTLIVEIYLFNHLSSLKCGVY